MQSAATIHHIATATTHYKFILQPRLMKMKNINGVSNFSVCKPGWYHSIGSCWRQCPSGTYAAPGDIDSNVFCIACHYSCLSCKGPSDIDCITCYADSKFIWNNGRALCVVRSISWKMQSTEWFYKMTVVFLINLGLVIAVIIYFVFTLYRKRRSVHEYSKIFYSGNGKVHMDTELGNTYISDSE